MKISSPSETLLTDTDAKPRNTEYATLTDLYLRDPRNLAFFNGTSRRIYTISPTNGVIFLSVIMLILLWAIVSQIASDYRQRREMEINGARTQAVVTGMRTEKISDSDGSSTHHYTSYSFYAPGAGDGENIQYTFEREVSASIYNKRPEGTQVQLTYLPTNPGLFRVDGDEFPAYFETHILTGILAAAFFLILALMVFRRYRRNHLLFLRGQLLYGAIVFANKSIHEYTDEDGDICYAYRLYVGYRFQNPTGAIVEREFKKGISQKEYELSFPMKGTPVAILYVNDSLFERL